MTGASAAVARATVGRVPIVGGTLAAAATDLVRQEVSKVSLLEDKGDDPKKDQEGTELKAEPPGKHGGIEESMYHSAIAEPHPRPDGSSPETVTVVRASGRDRSPVSDTSRSEENMFHDGEVFYNDDDGDIDMDVPAVQWVWLTAGIVTNTIFMIFFTFL